MWVEIREYDNNKYLERPVYSFLSWKTQFSMNMIRNWFTFSELVSCLMKTLLHSCFHPSCRIFWSLLKANKILNNGAPEDSAVVSSELDSSCDCKEEVAKC